MLRISKLTDYGIVLRKPGMESGHDFGNIEYTDSGLGLGFRTSGAHMTIASLGKVGIGTDVPKNRLDVEGGAVVGDPNYYVDVGPRMPIAGIPGGRYSPTTGT